MAALHSPSVLGENYHNMGDEFVTDNYQTDWGEMIHGDCEQILALKKNIFANLIFTSPPFPLNRVKYYGNMSGQNYIEWFCSLAKLFKQCLSEDGSIVIEMGNAWNKREPTYSTLPIETLLRFKEQGKFYLCQEFIYYNPAKLPTPIEWVNKKRIRVKDSFTRIWWLSKTPYPKANNRNVLKEYSTQMNKLLQSGKYNAGKRPSEHCIGSHSFRGNNQGAIPSNVIIAPNTASTDNYIKYCKNHGISIHPARMPKELPLFFIKMLTEENDIVLDPFAGSNTTGWIAETLHRRWISIESNLDYVIGSKGRFQC